MSEQGRHAFLAAEGLDDWVVLHGGPTAVFSTPSFTESAELAAEIAKTVKLDNATAQLNIVSNRLTVRLTREVWNIEAEHIEMARSISKVASALGAIAEPNRVQEVQVAIAAKPEAINLEFWRAVLGYEPMLDDNAVDPLGNSSTVWMQELDEAKDLRHGMHFDVSVAQDQAEKRLAAAVAAGGVVVDDSHAPAHWVLADSSGNKVCIVSWPDGPIDPQDSSEK
jgi:4a-hydroxytetrahydrobiopterin dehydratase